MLRETNCFDLFDMFSRGLQFVAGTVPDDMIADAWRVVCDENRAQPQYQRCRSRGVTRARPINVRELALVKSCKRRVRW